MAIRWLSTWVLLLAAAVSLAACSGDETIELSDVTPDEQTQDDENGEENGNGELGEGSLVLEITSHDNAQVITGDRTITLAGSVASATEITNLNVTLNDDQALSADMDDESFSIDLTLSNGENVVEVTAGNLAEESSELTLTLTYPFVTFENGQDASVVIGQPDFESSETNLSADGMHQLQGNPAIANGVLYIPDPRHARVLGFNDIPTSNGAAAHFVLGQDDFESDDQSVTQAGLFSPYAVSIHGNIMAVVDYGAHRVLIYHELPTATGDEPDVVLGQPNFSSQDWDTTASTLFEPESVHVTDGKVLVADRGNSRVLIWNSIPDQNGAPADLVLGQVDFESSEFEAGASGLGEPGDVWSDGERVVVVDADAHRVLIWETFPTSNGQAADIVLGQEDMDADGPVDISASSFEWPQAVASNGNQLIVADNEGDRVLVWNEFPTENNVAADHVLGTTVFDSLPVGGTSAGTFSLPTGLALYENQLFVADRGNRRVLIFDGL